MTIVDLPPPSDQSARLALRMQSQSRTAATTSYSRYFKRLIDVTLVVATAPITVPLIAVCAALVARDGHAPLFRQRRIGRNGRIFSIVKLRTMVPDAEARLAAHIAADPQAQAEWQAYQKLRQDPRVTALGRLLRRTSLDELPQLWNVLIGDMALVGPRPMMECQRPLYPGTRYFHLRPGITGLWQISARNNSTFADRSHFDADYWTRLSLTEDLRILTKTVTVVLKQTGT
jgi:exopolysaccharide production protein ExoY